MNPSQDTPLVCVAVSTRNRAAGVRRLLDALEAQTIGADRFEVVVADDASTDDTGDILRQATERSSLRLSAVRLERNRGAAAGRNAAWRAGTANVVAFTDDDCVPTPRWLEEGLQTMGRRDCIVVGATRPDPQQRHLLHPMARTLFVSEATFAPTANVFYLREDLEGVGGFDETFGLLGGEDTDLAWRTHRLRHRELVFAERALVYHDVRPRTFIQAVSETRRWAGLAIVAARHPDLARRAWPRRYFMRSSHPWAALAAFGIFSAFVFPPAVVLTLPWLRNRVLRGFPSRRWLGDLPDAPAMLGLDLAEFFVLARASLRYRGLLL